jgi:large repetitive protein
LTAGTGTGSFASQFNGTNPNGTWSLYILNDTPNSGGETTTIGSWTLNINATVIPEPSTLALIALGGAPLLDRLRRKTP